MIGILMIGHAHIATEMKDAVEHILGEQPLFEAVDVPNSNAIEPLQTHLDALMKTCNTGQGVLIFADLFGGTPCNMALGYLQQSHCEIISGFNLPALIKAVSLRATSDDLAEVASLSIESGKHYVCNVSNLYDASDKP